MYKRISVYVITKIKRMSSQILSLNLALMILFFTMGFTSCSLRMNQIKPNILFATSDDQGYPRLLGNLDIWESYPSFMGMGKFRGDHFAGKGVYNDYYLQTGQRIPMYLFGTKDYQLLFE